MRNLYFIFVLIFFNNTSCHRTKSWSVEFKNDPICGENVNWHVHLQDGFDHNQIKFVLCKDTFPVISATSGNNGCTNVYITNYTKYGETKIFLKNMPLFNLSKEVEKFNQDSLKVDIIIDDKAYVFEESLKYFQFFGLNYNQVNSSISYLKSKKCFECR